MRGSPHSGVRKHKPYVDLSGTRFGRLVVTRMAGYDDRGSIRWECRCDCNNTIVTRSDRLKSGRAKSCGCLQREFVAEVGHKNRTHGLCYTSLYRIWTLIIQRCTNPNNPSFEDYGGRGIAVCSYIRSSAENLLSIIGPRPLGMSVDRINNNLGYSCGLCYDCKSRGHPTNIRWATKSQQARNKRTSVFIEEGSKKIHLFEWAENHGLKPETVRARLRRNFPLNRLKESVS